MPGLVAEFYSILLDKDQPNWHRPKRLPRLGSAALRCNPRFPLSTKLDFAWIT